MRYFVLDLNTAQLKYSSAPNKKGKVILFRDIKSINVIHEDKNPYADSDYPYSFDVNTYSRDYYLASSTKNERDMWINGFRVLFELI